MGRGAWGSPQAVAERAERMAPLPAGREERFVGYGFSAIAFASGDVLGLRRWPSSSVGPAYTALWHRLADGTWRLYSDTDAPFSCSRYIGSAIEREVVTPIRLSWPASDRLRVAVPEAAIEVEVKLRSTLGTVVCAGVCAALPSFLISRGSTLRVLEDVGRVLLGERAMRLRYAMPNGHRARLIPSRAWRIDEARARWSGHDLGAVISTDTVHIGPTLLSSTRLFSYHAMYFSSPVNTP